MREASVAKNLEDLPEAFNAATDLVDHNMAAGRSGKIAVIDAHGSYTYAELAERINRAANGLRDIGLQREQRILLCLLDTVDFPTVFLGAIKAGIVPVPLNTLLTTADYRWILHNSGAAAVVVSAELTAQWQDIAQDCPHVRFISNGGGPWTELDHLISTAADEAMTADTHRDEVAFWLYTSGSTGKPKGALHTHGSLRLTANLYGLGVAGYTPDDVVLSVAKQFFAYGLGNALTFPYAVGATVVLHKDRPTPQNISQLIQKHGVTILNGVPTFFAGWLADSELLSQPQTHKLRIVTSAGESLPAHIGRTFQSHFGVDVLDGLGSTEMLHIFLSQRPGDVRYGVTGRPVPGYDLRVVREDGSLAAPGELGELQVKGPTSAIGYWKNKIKSNATYFGEWVRTGDKYICDEQGWYTYGGRSDDMLKVGGIYVSPMEIEEALICHADVLEAAVVGVPDVDGLIKPYAHVVLKSGANDGLGMESELKAHVKALLAPYKYPRWISFTDELPKTATGKIQRYKLRDSVASGT